MKTLHVAEGLNLPLDWMTMSTVAYGARGSGKTTLGRVMAEEVHLQGQRFCAVDLKGDWWGLRASASGTEDGLPVVIFGGDHADLPLEDGAGGFVAETVAALSQSCILDLEHFSKGKQLRFLADFFEALYDANRTPLLLLMDEAQRYAPQRPMSPEATRCLGAVEDLVKLGRKHGIGPVVFTQRGSGLNKEVSELCDMLVAFRTPGPLDQGRVKDWLEANATKAEADEVMGKLAGMHTGTAVFASGHPGLKVFTMAKVRLPNTFDSSATPAVGRVAKVPRRMAPVELDALRSKMSTAIETAKANDPKELKARIISLEHEMNIERAKKAAEAKVVEKVVERIVEKPVLPDGFGDRMLKAVIDLSESARLVNEAAETVAEGMARAGMEVRQGPKRDPLTAASEGLRHIARPPGTLRPHLSATLPDLSGPAWPEPAAPRVVRTPATLPRDDGPLDLRAGARKMLDILARHHPVKLTVSQWATLCGMTKTGGTWRQYMSSLKRAGYFTEEGNLIVITPAGLAAAGVESASPMSADEVREMWRSKVRLGERKLLDALVAVHPAWVSTDALAEAVGMEPSGGTFRQYIGHLRRNELIESEGGHHRASSTMLGL